MRAEHMIPRQEMISTIQGVYESYGFTPLKTPALERYSTLAGKYGEEADKLMYKFEDNGGRMVALRYDQTVPLARVVAQYGNSLPSPYKRYTVGEAWRGERPQKGRYREFTQFDADTVGTSSPIADAEIVAMMSDAMTALGANSVIRVNNRRILDGLAKKAGAKTDEESIQIITTIDRVEKIGQKAVVEQIGDSFGADAEILANKYLSIDSDSAIERLAQIEELLRGSEGVEEGTDNLKQVFEMLKASGYRPEQVTFDQTIARGLDYYTGIVYETTLSDLPEIGSVCSGGRYDRLIGSLGGPDTPAVGTSIGVDRLYDGLRALGKLKESKTTTEVLVANFEGQGADNYMRVATALRKLGIPSEVYYEADKIGKQIGFANKMGIPYAVLIGPDEIKQGTGIIKSLDSRDQVEVPIEDIPKTIKDLREEK